MFRLNGWCQYEFKKEFHMEQWLLPIFLIISGLSMCGVSFPQWVSVIGGICGILAGVLMLV
jgi:hypothetical protein